MKKQVRMLALFIAILLSITAVVSGCTSGNNTETSAKTEDGEKQEQGKSEDDTMKEADLKIPMTMFMGNSGVDLPDNVSVSNNKFINIVKDYANVDLQVELISSADLATKFNLMLASGNIPDVVHEHWMQDQAYEAGRAGAFLDLKPFYDKSPQVQKYITPQMLELAKDPVSGSYFRMPMAWTGSPQGYGVIARYDLIEKYNAGVWPESVDQWVELMRKIKKADPSAMILTNWVNGDDLFTYGGTAIFQWYGALPYAWRISGGQIVPNVVTPEYKAAVALMRQLYSEGLLDKEFATNDRATYYSNWYNRNVLLTLDSVQQLPAVVALEFKKENPQGKVVFAPFLKQYPQELADLKYTKGGYATSPIMGHGLYISAKTKNPERAWKVIEGFYSDELRDRIFWGTEGETYTVRNGVRVPDGEKMAAKENAYGHMYAVGVGFVAEEDAEKAKNEQVLGAELAKQVYDSMAPLDEAAKQNGLLPELPGYMAPEEATMKMPESKQMINKITVKAIMGEITMDQFEGQIKDWEAKYRKLIFDPMQQYLDANKDKLRNLGVKSVDW